MTKEDAGARNRAQSLISPEDISLEEGLLAHQEEEYGENKDVGGEMETVILIAPPKSPRIPVEHELDDKPLISS